MRSSLAGNWRAVRGERRQQQQLQQQQYSIDEYYTYGSPVAQQQGGSDAAFVSSDSDERFERDVNMLNRCFEDIELFMARIQVAALARRDVDAVAAVSKSRERVAHGLLHRRAQPPAEADFVDIFRKFKLSFNLLAHLKAHIYEPSAPELLHTLFTPLPVILEASHWGLGRNVAPQVIAPLLTLEARELLQNCLSTHEHDVWMSLGEAWRTPPEDWSGPPPANAYNAASMARPVRRVASALPSQQYDQLPESIYEAPPPATNDNRHRSADEYLSSDFDRLSMRHRRLGEERASPLQQEQEESDATSVSSGSSERSKREVNTPNRRLPSYKTRDMPAESDDEMMVEDALAAVFREAGLTNSAHAVAAELRLSTLNDLLQTTDSELELLKVMETLGSGTFAVVKRAHWTQSDGRRIDVAVKILRDASQNVMDELRRESGSLVRLSHSNVLRQYGVVSHPACIVFELCQGGALLDRLRATNKARPLMTTLVEYILQICSGMAYLEARRAVHRDLACRNVLLSADERVCKIADFGLTRTLEENERLYVMSGPKRVPFAWCPPEALRHRQFSTASDVWAFGVVMWEVTSFGEEPWIGLRGAEVLRKIEAGERLSRPAACSNRLYQLMQSCWHMSAKRRPRFAHLLELLKDCDVTVAECRVAHGGIDNGSLNEWNDDLYTVVGDRIALVHDVGEQWYGQSMRTRRFGWFPRSSVVVREASVAGRFRATSGNDVVTATAATTAWVAGRRSFITPPLRSQKSTVSTRMPPIISGSSLHIDHGDARGGLSGGKPHIIDPVYRMVRNGA